MDDAARRSGSDDADRDRDGDGTEARPDDRGRTDDDAREDEATAIFELDAGRRSVPGPGAISPESAFFVILGAVTTLAVVALALGIGP